MSDPSTSAAGELVPSFRLDGRVAVVTGASEGIGQNIALAFAAAGAHLALVSRQPERLASTVEQIRAGGGEARAYRADLRSVDDIQRLRDRVLDDWKTVTILVNAAGMPLTRSAFDVTEHEWDTVVTTNLKSVFFICTAFGAHMAEQGYGKIINLSSTYAESVGKGKSVYAVTKAGVSHLTRALANEWASLGVRVNALAPTTTITPTRQSVLADPERAAWLKSRIPMGRYGETGDLLGSALFLAAPASDFVTGHTLYVDGGWHAAR